MREAWLWLASGFIVVSILRSCSSASAGDKTTLRFWAMGREGEVLSELIPASRTSTPASASRSSRFRGRPRTRSCSPRSSATPRPTSRCSATPGFPSSSRSTRSSRSISASPRRRTSSRSDYFPGIWNTNVVDGSDLRHSVVRGHAGDLLPDRSARKAGYDRMPTTWAEWRKAMEKIKSQMSAESVSAADPDHRVAAARHPRAAGRFAAAPRQRALRRVQRAAFREGFDFYVGFFRDASHPR